MANDGHLLSRADMSGNRVRYRVRLPGFLREDQDVGLGDAIKRATSIAGIRPCDGCARRANALNHVMAFTGQRHAGR